MKTAEQAIHDIVWKKVSELVNGNVYESRPMYEVGYPFSDFENSSVSFRGTKNGHLSKVDIRINIWDRQDCRKSVSEACNELFLYASRLHEAYGYRVELRVSDSTIEIMEDRTVRPSLWRGMVTLVFDIL